MVDIKSALRGAEGKTSLDGIEIDAGLKATLERLMPIYQKHWWPEHDRVNRVWIAAVQPLLERHGTALSQALTRTYDFRRAMSCQACHEAASHLQYRRTVVLRGCFDVRERERHRPVAAQRRAVRRESRRYCAFLA
jgi:hypothetical protein